MFVASVYVSYLSSGRNINTEISLLSVRMKIAHVLQHGTMSSLSRKRKQLYIQRQQVFKYNSITLVEIERSYSVSFTDVRTNWKKI